MRRVHRRAAARRDLIEHYVYLAEQADEDTAERFLMQAEQTFVDLAENREIGVSLRLRDPRLAELRKWRVKDFEAFLNLLSSAPGRRLDRTRVARGSRLVGTSGRSLKTRLDL